MEEIHDMKLKRKPIKIELKHAANDKKIKLMMEKMGDDGYTHSLQLWNYC